MCPGASIAALQQRVPAPSPALETAVRTWRAIGKDPKVQVFSKDQARLIEPDTQALKHLQVLGSQSAPRSLNFIFSPRWSAVGRGRPQGTYLLPDRPPTHTHTHTDLLINTNMNTIHKDHCHKYVFIDTHTWTQHVNMYRGTHCHVHTLHCTETH